jgi:hypothetical protein
VKVGERFDATRLLEAYLALYAPAPSALSSPRP